MEAIKELVNLLSELDDLDCQGYEEYEENFSNIMSGLSKISEILSPELSDYVYDLVEIYENEGYYNYGGKYEKKELRDKINKYLSNYN